MCIQQHARFLLGLNLEVKIDVAGLPTLEFSNELVFYLILLVWSNTVG